MRSMIVYVGVVGGLISLGWANTKIDFGPDGKLRVPIERRLHPGDVTASSYLWNDWNRFQENYHPNYVADDDPATAWVEGVEGNGEGQTLQLATSTIQDTSAVRVRVRNGYHKSPALFRANARVRTAEITLRPSGAKQVIEFPDEMAWHEVRVAQPAGPLTSIELTVKDVYPGERYADLCISDLQIYATSLTPEDPNFEQRKFDRLRQWRQERVAAAKAFAGQAVEAPLAPSYASAPLQPAKALAVEPAMAPWREAIAELERAKVELENAGVELGRGARKVPGVASATYRPAKLMAVAKAPIPTVDGLGVYSIANTYELADGVYLPHFEQAAVFWAARMRLAELSAGAAPAVVQKGKCKAPRYWVHRAARPDGQAQLRAVAMEWCEMVDERGGRSAMTKTQVMIYDAEGRLVLVGFDGDQVMGYIWGEREKKPVIAEVRAWMGNDKAGDVIVAKAH